MAAKFYPEVLSDRDKELFEALWGDLRAMYQHDVAMADNGIPFRMRIESFIREYLQAATSGGCLKRCAKNCFERQIIIGAAKEKIVDILESHEDSLSDGFGYYTKDVQAELLTIADEIIAALDTNEQNVSSHNEQSTPCYHDNTAQVIICLDCGEELSSST